MLLCLTGVLGACTPVDKNKQASDRLIEHLNKMEESKAGAPKQTIIINVEN